MALATLAIMQAASGRLTLMAVLNGNPGLTRPGLLDPPPLLPTAVPHLLLDLAILGWMVRHDRRVLGRIHGVTLIGGAIILVVHTTRHLFAQTGIWSEIAGLLGNA